MKKHLLICLFGLSTSLIAQTATPINDSIFHDGVYRKYVLYVPNIYTINDTVPLILNIHGGSGDGNQHMQFGDFRPIADTANFIVVHPTAMMGAGLLGSAPAPSWNLNANDSASNSDRAFLYNLIDTLRAQYNIDTNRIYSAGFSQGGVMGYSFACLNNTRFAAIASVSAGMFPDVYNICGPAHPTPIIEIHGTGDQIASYDGSASLFGTPAGMHTDTIIKYWVNYNNCNSVPTKVIIPNSVTSDNCAAEHYIYSGGDSGTTVELIKVISGGHSWPSDVATGGTTNMNGSPMQLGNRNMDFNACKEIWRFFNKYPLINYPPVAGVNSQSQYDNHVAISPNPSNGSFTLFVDDLISSPNIRIYNILGTLVYENSIFEKTTLINLPNELKGVFYYFLTNQNGLVKTGKLIIH